MKCIWSLYKVWCGKKNKNKVCCGDGYSIGRTNKVIAAQCKIWQSHVEHYSWHKYFRIFSEIIILFSNSDHYVSYNRNGMLLSLCKLCFSLSWTLEKKFCRMSHLCRKFLIFISQLYLYNVVMLFLRSKREVLIFLHEVGSSYLCSKSLKHVFLNWNKFVRYMLELSKCCTYMLLCRIKSY